MENQNDFELPQEFIDRMSNAMSAGEMKLPFTAPIISWRNGNANLKELGGVRYFGGWESDALEFENAVEERGGVIPAGFARASMVNDEGREYDAYLCRAFGVAIMGYRERWRPGKNGVMRSHTHILAYLAYRDNKVYVPWGPVVLSGKGYAGGEIKTALGDWNRGTAEARKKFAKNIPAWFFYAWVGTFGEKAKTRMAGKPGAQHPISPCQVFIPEKIDGDMLKLWYAGRTVAEEMNSLKDRAADWLEAWKKDDQPAAPDGADYAAPEDDSIPF